MNRQEVNREAQQMLGAVPGFLTALPDNHVGPMWESMRNLQLQEGRIPAKYQQFIMLGVSVYAKCKYCTEFHTQVARALGATQEEITEAAMLVGQTANWSNVLGGIQYDFEQFKREVRMACDTLTSNMSRQPPAAQRQPTQQQRH